jgi:hypothetical protein
MEATLLAVRSRPHLHGAECRGGSAIDTTCGVDCASSLELLVQFIRRTICRGCSRVYQALRATSNVCQFGKIPGLPSVTNQKQYCASFDLSFRKVVAGPSETEGVLQLQ